MDVDHLDCQGSFSFPCDPALFGAGEVTLRCNIWREEGCPAEAGPALEFVRRQYRQGYDRVLAAIFAAYRRSPLWDVWMGDTEPPVRLDFARKEELHPCIGTPEIDIALFGSGMLWALTFGGKENRLSIEHGLCAIFEGETLAALLDYTDFPYILRWWEDYKKHNILTKLPE